MVWIKKRPNPEVLISRKAFMSISYTTKSFAIAQIMNNQSSILDYEINSKTHELCGMCCQKLEKRP